jgi:hypothetical protein
VRFRVFAAVLAAGACTLSAPPAGAQADEAIRRKIIEASIAAYSGSCPCPYSTDRAGRRCGARSAYSRPGGESPRCYPSDVGAAEVAAYKAGG